MILSKWHSTNGSFGGKVGALSLSCKDQMYTTPSRSPKHKERHKKSVFSGGTTKGGGGDKPP